jgi:hypothetical protein
MLWKHVGAQAIEIGAGVYARPGETFEADLPEERVRFYTQIGAIERAEVDIRKARDTPQKTTKVEEESHGNRSQL